VSARVDAMELAAQLDADVPIGLPVEVAADLPARLTRQVDAGVHPLRPHGEPRALLHAVGVHAVRLREVQVATVQERHVVLARSLTCLNAADLLVVQQPDVLEGRILDADVVPIVEVEQIVEWLDEEPAEWVASVELRLPRERGAELLV